MASLSLCFPFSFLGSSTQIRRARQSWEPVSSSANSTRTPVSSPKNAWFRRSRIESLLKETRMVKQAPISFMIAWSGILNETVWYVMKGKPALPLALVLTNAAFNDLFDFWVTHFIKAGWLYTLQKKKWEIHFVNDGILLMMELGFGISYIIIEAIPTMEPHTWV